MKKHATMFENAGLLIILLSVIGLLVGAINLIWLDWVRGLYIGLTCFVGVYSGIGVFVLGMLSRGEQ